MKLVEIGLNNPKQPHKDEETDEVTYTPMEGARVLTMKIPDDVSTAEAFVAVTSKNGIAEKWLGDEAPTWVAAETPGLQMLLAEHFGCAEGKPADVEDTHWTENGPPGVDLSQDRHVQGQDPLEPESAMAGQPVPPAQQVPPQPGQPITQPGQET